MQTQTDRKIVSIAIRKRHHIKSQSHNQIRPASSPTISPNRRQKRKNSEMSQISEGPFISSRQNVSTPESKKARIKESDSGTISGGIRSLMSKLRKVSISLPATPGPQTPVSKTSGSKHATQYGRRAPRKVSRHVRRMGTRANGLTSRSNSNASSTSSTTPHWMTWANQFYAKLPDSRDLPDIEDLPQQTAQSSSNGRPITDRRAISGNVSPRSTTRPSQIAAAPQSVQDNVWHNLDEANTFLHDVVVKEVSETSIVGSHNYGHYVDGHYIYLTDDSLYMLRCGANVKVQLSFSPGALSSDSDAETKRLGESNGFFALSRSEEHLYVLLFGSRIVRLDWNRLKIFVSEQQSGKHDITPQSPFYLDSRDEVYIHSEGKRTRVVQFVERNGFLHLLGERGEISGFHYETNTKIHAHPTPQASTTTSTSSSAPPSLRPVGTVDSQALVESESDSDIDTEDDEVAQSPCVLRLGILKNTKNCMGIDASGRVFTLPSSERIQQDHSIQKRTFLDFNMDIQEEEGFFDAQDNVDFHESLGYLAYGTISDDTSSDLDVDSLEDRNVVAFYQLMGRQPRVYSIEESELLHSLLPLLRKEYPSLTETQLNTKLSEIYVTCIAFSKIAPTNAVKGAFGYVGTSSGHILRFRLPGVNGVEGFIPLGSMRVSQEGIEELKAARFGDWEQDIVKTGLLSYVEESSIGGLMLKTMKIEAFI